MEGIVDEQTRVEHAIDEGTQLVDFNARDDRGVVDREVVAESDPNICACSNSIMSTKSALIASMSQTVLV